MKDSNKELQLTELGNGIWDAPGARIIDRISFQAQILNGYSLLETIEKASKRRSNTIS